MNEIIKAKGRRGGRKAMMAMRAAPLVEDKRPIVPGMTSGSFRPLSDSDIKNIHEAALNVLETIGFSDAIPTCIEAVTTLGGFVNEAGRLCFPRALVEDVLTYANRDFTLFGQDPKHDLHPQGTRVYFGTGGAAVHIVDPVSGDYRDSQLADLYNMARLVDSLDNIHYFQRTAVPRDMITGHDLDINTLYASVSGTSKHVGTSFVNPDHVSEALEILHAIAGGEDKWRARPFVSQSNCFVVPPLKFAQESCQCLEVAVHGGMTVLLLSAGQAGATAPASLAGAVTQAVAECLAGLVYVNAIKKGAPAIFGTWPFVSDLRTGAMSGGSPEQALLSSACAQMGNFYDLPTGAASGMSDSKIPDSQSGSEKGYSHALIGNSGANLIYESAGMHASLLGACLESFVIDNDTIGAALRTIRGITTDPASLSVDVMRDVCLNGPGHYLGSEQTLTLMETDFVYPAVGDRSSPNQWEESLRPTALSNAIIKTKQILESHYPSHISPDVDKDLRKRFDIKLDRNLMQPNT